MPSYGRLRVRSASRSVQVRRSREAWESACPGLDRAYRRYRVAGRVLQSRADDQGESESAAASADGSHDSISLPSASVLGRGGGDRRILRSGAQHACLGAFDVFQVRVGDVMSVIMASLVNARTMKVLRLLNACAARWIGPAIVKAIGCIIATGSWRSSHCDRDSGSTWRRFRS